MRKLDVIDEVAKRTEVSKKVVSKVVDAIFEVLKDGLREEGEVKFIPYGIFKVIERNARKGKNPQTGEEITIPAKKVIKFVVGKKLKQAIE
ncbi:MAG: HU family DNA-binding protein [Caldimicrobium sp.]